MTTTRLTFRYGKAGTQALTAELVELTADVVTYTVAATGETITRPAVELLDVTA